jgi:hypothetical protein
MSGSQDDLIATALLGIDTLAGGDVMSPSGVGRFVADSWFSDAPLPLAYTHPSAARLRETGGALAKTPDVHAVDAYLAAVDVKSAIGRLHDAARSMPGLRGEYLDGVCVALEVMWDLAMEALGRGPEVPYDRSIVASIGEAPSPSRPEEKIERVRALLARAGHDPKDMVAATDAWRRARMTPMASVRALAGAFIAELDALTLENVVPHLPADLRLVPRANIRFLPIKDAWFSGSMNYLGRARGPDGRAEYEATYEINASLEISVPEFAQLVSHEVVPGHVTTFAYLQDLWIRRKVGFEATVQAMSTRAAALSEGIANNAILMAHGVTEIDQLPDEDLQLGVLLALLQDDAKNQASYLTWREKRPQPEIAARLRKEYLVSAERADKLSGAWARHPILGRMYLPAYRAGTERVASLRRRYAPEKVLPAIFGANGLVDNVTVERAIA